MDDNFVSTLTVRCHSGSISRASFLQKFQIVVQILQNKIYNAFPALSLILRRFTLMPLTWKHARIFMDLTTRHHLSGRVGALGRYFPVNSLTIGDMRRYGLEFGCQTLSVDHDVADDASVPDDHFFFNALGFESCESIDANDYEQADHIYDLNLSEPPSHLMERFDLLINNGTLEHVFNIPNALTSMTKMLKVGGCALHFLPVNNHMDHGFYQISPCLMYDYYMSNKLEILDSIMLRYTAKDMSCPWEQWGERPYNPYASGASLHHDGRLDGAVYALIFLARKVESSITGVTPIQGLFSSLWK